MQVGGYLVIHLFFFYIVTIFVKNILHMQQHIDVSVLLPVYNVSKYIEQCLVALFTQTKTAGVEFIIVNDGTPDNSIEIAREVASRYPNINLIIVDQPENRGLSAARGRGIDEASGDYVIFIDSDDWCEPTMIEELHGEITSKNADIVSCDMFYNYTEKVRYKKQPLPSEDGVECAKALLNDKIHGYIWNKIYSRKLFTDNKITFLDHLNMWEDVLVTTQLLCFAKRVVYLPKAYIHYRKVSSGSITNTATKRNRDNEIRVIKELENFAEREGFLPELLEPLTLKKLKTIHRCYTQFTKEQRAEYEGVFSEALPMLWSCKHLGFMRRLTIYLGEHNATWLLSAIRSSVNFIRRKK